MDIEETMVEQELGDTAEDSLPDEIAEVEQDESESLESLMGDEQPAEDAQETEPQSTSEPGYVKKRIEKAVSKAVAETEARMKAMFEEQMAPFRAKVMEDEAQELVRSRKVSDTLPVLIP